MNRPAFFSQGTHMNAKHLMIAYIRVQTYTKVHYICSTVGGPHIYTNIHAYTNSMETAVLDSKHVALSHTLPQPGLY